MKRQLLHIAARGIDSTPDALSTIQLDLEPLLHQMEQATPSVQLLRMSALVSMRQKAGYVPFHDSRLLDNIVTPDERDTHYRYTMEIMAHLKVIYWQKYHPAYPEWLHWVALTDAPIPPEALPLMLSLATMYPQTRGLTKKMIGSRGRWLTDYSGHRGWHWLKHIKPARRPRLTKYEKLEARVMQHIASVRGQRIPLEAIYELQRMTFPWSNRLSKKIVQTLDIYLSNTRSLTSDDLQKILDILQWSLHPNQKDTIIRLIEAYCHNYLNDYQTPDALAQILTFRVNLTDTFKDMPIQ